MPSGKRRLHSVSGRHYDDRLTECNRSFPVGIYRTHGNCQSAYRHRTKYFEAHYTPVTLIWSNGLTSVQSVDVAQGLSLERIFPSVCRGAAEVAQYGSIHVEHVVHLSVDRHGKRRTVPVMQSHTNIQFFRHNYSITYSNTYNCTVVQTRFQI